MATEGGKLFAGRIPRGKLDPRFGTALRCGGYMLAGFVTACARVLASGAPFGMAFVAAAGPGIKGVFALAGAALGYLLSGGIDWGIRYIAAAVLVYTVGFVFQELEFYKRGLFMPAIAGLVMALTGFLGSFSAKPDEIPLAAKLVLETSLAFGGCYFFREALSTAPRRSETDELRHSSALLISAACVLIAVGRIELFGLVSVGRWAALLLVMASAMQGGMLTGAAVGTVMGIAMDISHGGAPFYTMVFAFSGLLAGVFGKHGRILFTLSFLVANAIAVICAWDSDRYLGALLECFCAAVVFVLLPTQLLTHVGVILQRMERGSGETNLRRYVAGHVRELGDAYAELFEVVRRNIEEPYNDENIARIFDRAADQVCVKCKFKNRCWNAEYVDTLSAMNDASCAMQEHGSLENTDFPGFFREKCVSLMPFVAAVNGELRAMAYRRQLQAKLSENRSAAWGQYQDMAAMLGRIAAELGSVNGADPLAERRLQRYLKSLDIDAETAVYRDGRGRLRVSIESGRLSPLTGLDDWIEKLSAVVGVRLCLPNELPDGCSCMTLLEAEPLAVSVGIAALKKRGEKVSGDRGSYFKTDSGVLCVILSDGMGTGSEAAKESAEIVGILEKFLRSGADPAVAMKLLNSVMLLRGGDDSWGYATVDLMCVDLFSGETCFYKYGAAPSYVMNSGRIRRIKGETLAAGLNLGDGEAPDLVRMRLRPGSTAVIASDGVIVDEDDGWLKTLLQKSGEDMKSLAKATLKEAEQQYGAEDDMTVVTVRVEERV